MFSFLSVLAPTKTGFATGLLGSAAFFSATGAVFFSATGAAFYAASGAAFYAASGALALAVPVF